MLLLMMIQGTVALRPPICGDLFGMRSVGLMSAYQLSVVMPAALIGPQVVAHFRNLSVNEAIAELSSQVPAAEFQSAFGASHDMLPQLVEARTVTINRLMELVPEHTPDPTPFVYDKSLYLCAGLYSLAFLTNATLQQLEKRLHATD